MSATGDSVERESWFRRNWVWAVPVGCLSMLLLFFGAILMLVVFVFGLIKESDVYAAALERARADAAVVAALGAPIAEGTFISGNINTSGPSGDAELAIPLSGPDGSGTLYVEAIKRVGRWEFERLELEVEGTDADGTARRIDLLD